MPRLVFFPFYGPSYRSPHKVVELRLDCVADPIEALPRAPGEVLDELRAAGACDDDDAPDFEDLPTLRDAALAEMMARLALWLQQRCAHPVRHHRVFGDRETRRWTALVEHEDPQVGMAAVQWASGLLLGKAQLTAEAWRTFCDGAGARVPSAETQAIIAALRRRAIPFLQCEREPLAQHFRAAQRIRPNGLLVVGQGSHHRVLDGSFCVSQASSEQRALLQNPDRRQARLREAGWPVGKAGKRSKNRVDLLWIEGQLFAVSAGADGSRRALTDVDAGWAERIQTFAGQIGSSLLSLKLEIDGLSRSPVAEQFTVLDFELAPDLAAWAGEGPDAPVRLEAAADRLVSTLFPGDSTGRIPIAAITGTNGKTTTSRMVARMMSVAGLKPALVCSDGICIDGAEVSHGDGSAFIGHARALADPRVHGAVLETHHRGIAVRGFAFDQCDVAACLNVTPDHLAPGEIETLGEMIRIKQGLVEQAAGGAVLNGQDAGCLGMLGAIRAPRVVLFASQPGYSLPESAPGKQLSHCRVDAREDGEWVVLDGPEGRVDIIRVDDIPATFGGAARFNLENAMAAIGCAHLMGLSLAFIRAALRDFSMGYDSTPGRLNLYDRLPFRVMVDYAHNLDGIARLAEFVRRLPVQGRRMMLLAAPGDRTDDTVRSLARAAAGGFDHFVCRAYPNLRGRPSALSIPQILADALREAGVPQQAVEMYPDAAGAIERILALGRPGDLVVLQLSHPEFAAVHERLLRMGQRPGDDHAS